MDDIKMYKVDGVVGAGYTLTDAGAALLRSFGHPVTEVAKAAEAFSREISDGYGEVFSILVEDEKPTWSTVAGLFLQFREDGEPWETEGFSLTRDAGRQLRDTLTEWLGDGQPAEITVDSPEPDRSKRYVDNEDDTWAYDVADGGWKYDNRRHGRPWSRVQELYTDYFPWRAL